MNFIKGLPIAILVGCQAQAPSSQVIVTLSGTEITSKEFEFEKRFSNSKSEKEVLESLIDRKILVKHALEQNLNLEEEFHFSLRRSEEELLVDTLKKRITKKYNLPLEKEVWITINREPWRYKNRMRLYLTRNDEKGERTVSWIDTADYDENLPETIYTAEPGSVLNLDGQDWNVHLRESLVASPEMMLKASKKRFLSKHVENEVGQLISKHRKNTKIIYHKRYEPSYNETP